VTVTEYQVRPSRKQVPPAQDLLEGLHRRGWKVEINLKGEGGSAWETLRFFRPGPPEEVECFLLHDAAKNLYTVSLPAMPANGAPALQYHVVMTLVDLLGGSVEEAGSGRTLTLAELDAWGARFHPLWSRLLKADPKHLGWALTAWAVAAAGLLYSAFGDPERRLAVLLLAGIPAFLAAVGLTFFSHRE
jgi:hypothetical protein